MSTAVVQTEKQAEAATAQQEVQIPRTVLEVFESLPEGTRAELIDNVIYMAPAPELPHQRTNLKLARLLSDFVEAHDRGEVFIAPVDVYLDGTAQCVEPDLVVLKEQSHLLSDGKKIRGTPAILIEILSSNKNHDLIKKRELYARHGVQEYFIVDPEAKHVMHLALRGASYEVVREETGLLHSDLLNADFRF